MTTNLLHDVSDVLAGLKPIEELPDWLPVVWRDGHAVVFLSGQRHYVSADVPEPAPWHSWLNAPNYVEPHPEDVAQGACPETGRKIPSCAMNWGCQRVECKAELAEYRRIWRSNRRRG